MAGHPSKGTQTARLVLGDFTDYQCPFCERHVRETWPQLEREYVSTGKLRYVVRDFPIESTHPQAFKAHEAAHCAGDQGKYWEMHQRLFANQRALGADDLAAHAQALGLEVAGFKQCLQGGRHSARVRRDLGEGQRAGVTGTPTFFLGWVEANGTQVRSARKLVGAQPYNAFKEAIDGLLSSGR